MADNVKSLAARIADISAAIDAVAKDGRNAQQGYNFIEYAVVAAKLRALHKEHGVAVIPSVDSYRCDQMTTAKGATGFHYILDMLFTVINTDNPEDKLEVKWVGEATDYGDKGVNKAITSATKYLLMRLYNISEKGDKDADATDPEPATRVEQGKQTNSPVDKINFAEVKETLTTIDDNDSLDAYWRSLGRLSEKQKGFLQKFFAKRRGEINGK